MRLAHEHASGHRPEGRVTRGGRWQTINMDNFDKFRDVEWSRLHNDGFQFLKDIPSSKVLSHIAIFEENQEKFTLDYLKKISNPLNCSEHERRELWNLLIEEKRNINYFPFTDRYRMLKNYLAIQATDKKEILAELAETLSKIESPKATDIRKYFFPKLNDFFSEKPNSMGGGVWSLPIAIKGHDVKFWIDFGGINKFRYSFDLVIDQTADEVYRFVSYEELLGLGEPNWDLMRMDKMDDHAEHFVKVLEKTLYAIELSISCQQPGAAVDPQTL
jgi:hypothetical protein